MNIYVRVDASHEIGTGHFYRCFTLGLQATSLGYKVTFVSRFMPNYLVDLLHEHKIYFKSIYKKSNSKVDNLNHSKWLEVSQIEDAQNLGKILLETVDLLIIDHYAIDYTWEIKLRDFVKKIFVIDDLGDRKHECDFLLDQNYYTNPKKRYINKVPNTSQIFLGPKYALLRDEFRSHRKKESKKNIKLKRIFIFFGGVDKDNYSEKALKALKNIDLKNINIDVVVGGQNPNKEAIKNLCENNKYNFYCDIKHIAKIMSKADLAIGAGGSSSWERCCLGLPSIIVPIAENQIEIAKNLHNYGAAICIENSSSLIHDIQNAILKLSKDKKTLLRMSELCFNLVDGNGVLRVLKKLKK